jgi:hypothetical protein
MNKLIPKLVIVVIGLLPGVSCLHAQFSAELADVTRGKKKIYMLQSDGSRYRYDFDESGMKGTVIVDPSSNKTAVLLPDEKFVHYTEPTSQMSLMNDPFQSFKYAQERYTEKPVGKEKIAGLDTEKTELYSSDQLVYTAWFSDELNFIVKMVNNMVSDTYMELSNIKKTKIDPGIFIIPEDYTEVDERMRPVIPEPPPPDSWNTIKAAIPLKGEYKRGDLISFKVPESKNYKIILTNETTEPAKVIRIAMRDGKELDDNEQGPISYRTRRLYAEESFTNTYSWKAGDEKILQVHEGKLLIEIVPEER